MRPYEDQQKKFWRRCWSLLYFIAEYAYQELKVFPANLQEELRLRWGSPPPLQKKVAGIWNFQKKGAGQDKKFLAFLQQLERQRRQAILPPRSIDIIFQGHGNNPISAKDHFARKKMVQEAYDHPSVDSVFLFSSPEEMELFLRENRANYGFMINYVLPRRSSNS